MNVIVIIMFSKYIAAGDDGLVVSGKISGLYRFRVASLASFSDLTTSLCLHLVIKVSNFDRSILTDTLLNDRLLFVSL